MEACTHTKAELTEEVWRLMEELYTGGMNSRRAMTCVCQFIAEAVDSTNEIEG